jgi:hypothetical protein
MFERLQRLYTEGRITKNGLMNAVAKGILTAEEFKKITGGEYDG